MKVIKFPDTKVSNYRKDLFKKAEELESYYVTLDRIHQELHELEQHTYELEQAYNVTLGEYAALIPHNDLEVVLLTYSTRAIVVDNVDGTYSIKWGEEGTPVLMHPIDEDDEDYDEDEATMLFKERAHLYLVNPEEDEDKT